MMIYLFCGKRMKKGKGKIISHFPDFAINIFNDAFKTAFILNSIYNSIKFHNKNLYLLLFYLIKITIIKDFLLIK